MRVYFDFPVKSLSGKREGTVYAAYSNNSVCVAKAFVAPTTTTQNTTIGLIANNLAVIYPQFHTGWMDNLKTYTHRHNLENAYGNYPMNFYAFFTQMWYAVQNDDPTISLATVTLADIALLDIEVKTVAEAIESDFLPPIANYSDLTDNYIPS